MGGVFCKNWKMGVFLVKKWTFPQHRVHYVQYQYFLFYIYSFGECVRTQRTPPAYRPGILRPYSTPTGEMFQCSSTGLS